MGLFKRYSAMASRKVSDMLGEPCVYLIRSTGQTLPDVSIKITKGKELKDEYGSVYATRTEVSIFKTDLPVRPEQYDVVTDTDGEEYIIDAVLRETTNKYWLSVNG